MAVECCLRCPRCNGSRLIEVRRFLDSVEPCAFIRCEVETCGWEDVALQGARAAAQTGKAAHDRALEAVLATQRERAAAANTAREAEARRARIAQAEASIRAWATAPVGNRIARTGEGWTVHPPDFAPGVDLSDLDEAVRTLYAAAVAEAEVEVRRRDLEDVERLAKAQAEQPKLWADQAKREAEERNRRREERSDVELSHPT